MRYWQYSNSNNITYNTLTYVLYSLVKNAVKSLCIKLSNAVFSHFMQFIKSFISVLYKFLLPYFCFFKIFGKKKNASSLFMPTYNSVVFIRSFAN